MKNGNSKYFIMMTLFLFLLMLIIKAAWHPAKETITFFPIHQNAFFTKAETAINLENAYYDENKYKISFELYSKLDRDAYLRQDIGFLYKNGKLLKSLGIKWKQHTSELRQKDMITDSEGGYYQGLTFHYAEIHEGDTISSVEKMSEDSLYIIQSKFNPTITSFRIPNTNVEKQWQKTFQQLTEQQLLALWKQGMQKLGIHSDQYTAIPLTKLPKYNNKPLPGFTKSQSQNIIGRLWEGLYKNYFLSIKKEDGTSISPLGSSVPLILLNKNKKELLVIIITKDKDTVLLKQNI